MTETQFNARLNDVTRAVGQLRQEFAKSTAQLTTLNDGIKFAQSPNLDAFGRLRVSNPLTLFDSKQVFDNQPLIWDDSEVSGSGTTSTHSVDEARSRLAVSATTAGKRVRQTFMRFNYQPGKSQLAYLTGVPLVSGGGAGIVTEFGLFDDDNGIFFRYDEGTLKFVIRSNVTGSPVDTEVAQSSWNLDKFDGSGEGASLDLSKTQLLVIDLEWLGVGSVRVGWVYNGKIIYAHQFNHANIKSTVYMSTPNLPLRYSIENDGTGAASSMDHNCSTIISEGGQAKNGVLRYASTEGTHVACASENVVYAIIGIRLKSTHIAETVDVEKVAIQIQDGSNTGEWIVILNPTVTGTFNYTGETNSGIEVGLGTGAPTVTNGVRLDGGFAQSSTGGGGSGGGTEAVLNAIRLGAAIDGTVDEIVLCWMPNGGTSAHEIEGSIHWRELS